MLLAEGGWGMLYFGVAVAVGLKVTISPLWRPSASCLPFGDQETAQFSINLRLRYYHTHLKLALCLVTSQPSNRRKRCVSARQTTPLQASLGYLYNPSKQQPNQGYPPDSVVWIEEARTMLLLTRGWVARVLHRWKAVDRRHTHGWNRPPIRVTTWCHCMQM